MKKNINKNIKTRSVVRKNIASTTPLPCNKDDYCSLPQLVALIASKEKTKATVQSRIDANQYAAAIASAQAVVDGINAKIENNNNAITQKEESIKTLNSQINLCIVQFTKPSEIGACQNAIRQNIKKIQSEIKNLNSDIKKINAEELPPAKKDLTFAKNRQKKDQEEIVSCQNAIDKLNARIDAIKKACKGQAPKCP